MRSSPAGSASAGWRATSSGSSAETRRAEYGHWLAMAFAPVFALWNPLVGLVLMATYSVVVNAPFIAIQRYNRQRAQRVLTRRSQRDAAR